ncbi:DUF1707 domain-containing protein [Corynebacterium sp. S7]
MSEPAEAQPSRKRATDDERQNTANILSEAMSNGQLNYQEFDERTKKAWATTYSEDLNNLVRDLIDPDNQQEYKVPATAEHRSPAPGSYNRVTPSQGGTKRSIGILGATSYAGDWMVARNHTSIGFMGANMLDLREASFAAQQITISAWAFMGGIQIIVPEDVRVKSEGHGFMGGFAVRDGAGVTHSMNELPADAPVVRVVGLGFMGGVEVVRKPRKDRPGSDVERR